MWTMYNEGNVQFSRVKEKNCENFQHVGKSINAIMSIVIAQVLEE